jgi:hypothetical protein
MSVGKGMVFFDLKGKEVRMRTLELMGEYGITFTDGEKTRFQEWMILVCQSVT